MDNFYKQLMQLAIIGAALSFAKELRDGKINKNDWSKAVGRILLGAGLCISAAAIQLYFPTAPWLAVVGLGALIVVMGDVMFGKVLDRAIDKIMPPKDKDGA